MEGEIKLEDSGPVLIHEGVATPLSDREYLHLRVLSLSVRATALFRLRKAEEKLWPK